MPDKHDGEWFRSVYLLGWDSEDQIGNPDTLASMIEYGGRRRLRRARWQLKQDKNDGYYFSALASKFTASEEIK